MCIYIVMTIRELYKKNACPRTEIVLAYANVNELFD